MQIDQHSLNPLVGRIPNRHIAIEHVSRHGKPARGHIAQRRIPERPACHGRLNPCTSRRTLYEVLGHAHARPLGSASASGIPSAKNCLNLAKLRRLKTARRLQPPAERIELQRGHRLENVDLPDTGFHDGADAP